MKYEFGKINIATIVYAGFCHSWLYRRISKCPSEKVISGTPLQHNACLHIIFSGISNYSIHNSRGVLESFYPFVVDGDVGPQAWEPLPKSSTFIGHGSFGNSMIDWCGFFWDVPGPSSTEHFSSHRLENLFVQQPRGGLNVNLVLLGLKTLKTFTYKNIVAKLCQIRNHLSK